LKKCRMMNSQGVDLTTEGGKQYRDSHELWTPVYEPRYIMCVFRFISHFLGEAKIARGTGRARSLFVRRFETNDFKSYNNFGLPGWRNCHQWSCWCSFISCLISDLQRFQSPIPATSFSTTISETRRCWVKMLESQCH
jgi:hypothetical protein